MNPKVKKWILFFGLAFLLNSFVMFNWLIFEIYATPDKIIILDMNAYGEATIEFILILISIPIVLITTWFDLDKISELNKQIKSSHNAHKANF